MSRLPRLALVLLAVITMVGLGLRVEAAGDGRDYQSTDEQAYVQLAHGLGVEQVYRHPDLRGPVHWPPGVPGLFAIGALVDPQPLGAQEDLPAAYPLQVLVAVALIPATFVLGLLVAGPIAGLVAAGAVAVYPPLATSTADLLSEPLGALLLVCGLIAMVLALQRPAWWRLGGAGLLLGATILTRVDLLLVPALAALVAGLALWRRESPRAGLRAGGTVALGCLLLALPWSWYASRQTPGIALISSGGASNLFVGTYLPGDGRMFGLKRALADEVRVFHPGLRDATSASFPQEQVLDVVAARRPELERDAALRAEGLENLRRYAWGEPVDFAAMMASKVGRLWLGYTVGSRGARQAWITAMHLTFVLVSAAGLAYALWRRRSPELALMALILLYVTALNAVLVSEARHNLAVMPVLLTGGAVGVSLLVASRRSVQRPARRMAEPA